MKRGKGSRPIMEFEIKAAQRVSKSAAETAKKLGIAYNTYKKWAIRYNLFEKLKNPKCVGIVKKKLNPKKGQYSIGKILNGDFPNFPPKKIKEKLIKANIKEYKCEKCGFEESRIDGEKPIIIHFLDGNRKNHKLENIELVCYNCYFCYIGKFFGNEKKFNIY